MDNHQFNQPYFNRYVQQAIESIKHDYVTGAIDITQAEFECLVQSYESMLNGANAVFHYRAKMLTRLDKYLLTQKMSKGLLTQHQKCLEENEDNIVAFAIQLKRDADIRQLG